MERCLGKCVIHSCKYLLSSFCHLLPVFSQLLFVILESVFVLLSVPSAAFPLAVGGNYVEGELLWFLSGNTQHWHMQSPQCLETALHQTIQASGLHNQPFEICQLQ